MFIYDDNMEREHAHNNTMRRLCKERYLLKEKLVKLTVKDDIIKRLNIANVNIVKYKIQLRYLCDVEKYTHEYGEDIEFEDNCSKYKYLLNDPLIGVKFCQECIEDYKIILDYSRNIQMIIPNDINSNYTTFDFKCNACNRIIKINLKSKLEVISEQEFEFNIDI